MTDRPGSVGAGAPRRSGGSDPRLTLYLLKQVELAAKAQLEEAVRPVGLTAVQYTALSALLYREGLSSAQLARRSFVSAQAMNQTVFTLERRGLIRREADPDNRRILRISLTDRGRATLDGCERDVVGLERRMLATLSGPEIAQFRHTLDECRRALAAGPSPHPRG